MPYRETTGSVLRMAGNERSDQWVYRHVQDLCQEHLAPLCAYSPVIELRSRATRYKVRLYK